MSVVMRLRRMGGNQRPFYRLVVTDSRNPREGRFLERLGDYDPIRKKDNVRLNSERIVYWLSQGAIPSVRVSQFLRDHKISWKSPKALAAAAARESSAGVPAEGAEAKSAAGKKKKH